MPNPNRTFLSFIAIAYFIVIVPLSSQEITLQTIKEYPNFRMASLPIFERINGETFFKAYSDSGHLFKFIGDDVIIADNFELDIFFGRFNGMLVLSIANLEKSDRGREVTFLPTNGEMNDFDISWINMTYALIDYQNGFFFSAQTGEGEGYDYIPFFNNGNTRKKTKLPFDGAPIEISPDKMHLLAQQQQEMIIWNIAMQKVTAKTYSSTYIGMEKFYSNEIIYVSSNPGYWQLVTLSGQTLGKFILRLENGEPIYYMYIVKDQNRGIVGTYDKRYIVIVDTTPIEDWLNNMGYLFKPTTAVLNIDKVRIRENPNLEAKIFDLLNKGDAVDVLDRSSLKVKIDNLEDWWYRVKTADGRTGWVYGAYLTLKDKQGAIKFKEIN